MSFKLVNYSQQDPQWKANVLGFGDPGDTLGYIGCALSSTAMLLSGFGYIETPGTLNQKLKNIQGFISAGIKWGSVSQLYPHVTLKSIADWTGKDALLGQIDASLAAGQPVIARVDSSPAPGIQWHFILLYQKQNNDYLMLDPWPYPVEKDKQVLLMPRYNQGLPLQRAISYAVFYQCLTPGSGTVAGSAPMPASQPSKGSPDSRASAQPKKFQVTVLPSVGASGLKLHKQPSQDSPTLAIKNAGTTLIALDPPNRVKAKVGIAGQWLNVRDSNGRQGYVAAEYVQLLA